MSVTIACVVEGKGEVEALPVLIRNICRKFDPPIYLDVPVPIRSRRRLQAEGELERCVDLAAEKTQREGAILVLLDCDDGCPAQEGRDLLHRVRTACTDIPSAVVLAYREYETWFLAAAESLRGCRGLPNDLATPEDPERIRGAKEWLAKRMGGKYSETRDQPALTAALDLAQAMRSRSFQKLHKEITRLCTELREKP